MARVDLEKVSKLYPGNVKAVDAVDLSIADQEFVVLVGPSGTTPFAVAQSRRAKA